MIDGIELAAHEEKLKDELEKLNVQLAKCTETTDKQTTSLKENGGSDTDIDDSVLNLEVSTTSAAIDTQVNRVVGYSQAEIQQEILHLEKLLRFVDSEFAPQKQKFKDLMADGDIRFDLLWLLFPPDSQVAFKDDISGLPMAGKVTLAMYHNLD